MKNSQLAEDSQTFAVCAEQRRGCSKDDRTARRRAENSRRRLVQSIVRVCNSMNDDQVCSVAEYVLLIAE